MSRRRMSFLFWLIAGGCYQIFRFRFGLRVSGLENIPRTGSVVVVSNHASYIDPPLLGGAFRGRQVHYLARDTLFRSWWLGPLLRGCGVVPIKREHGDVSALRKGLKLLQEGRALGLFPEGQRTPDGRLQPAKGGIGFLIAKAGVPVVPAYIGGTFAAWPRGGKLRPGPVTVTFGAPLTAEELLAAGRGSEAYRKIADLVMRRIAALGGVPPPPTDDPSEAPKA